MLPATHLLLLLAASIRRLHRPARKRLTPRILVRVLLALVHLLLELLPLLLVGKGHAEHALLALEAEEEDAVLVEGEGVVDFLVPDDPAVRGREVDEFDPEGVAHQVVGEHGRALESGVGPSSAVGVGDVEFRDRYRMDLVRRLRYGSFDDLFLIIAEY